MTLSVGFVSCHPIGIPPRAASIFLRDAGVRSLPLHTFLIVPCAKPVCLAKSRYVIPRAAKTVLMCHVLLVMGYRDVHKTRPLQVENRWAIRNCARFVASLFDKAVPRKNPLPEFDIALGRRLEAARKEALIPRAALAVQLGISTNRLYSYEAGKAKLPWSVGDAACRALDLNQTWLATGQGEKKGFWPVVPEGAFSDADFRTVHDENFLPVLAGARQLYTDPEIARGLAIGYLARIKTTLESIDKDHPHSKRHTDLVKATTKELREILGKLEKLK